MRKNKLYLNSKKGQSAMEYLMTYGWSILIIAIVLVSLFELGIFGNNSLSGMAHAFLNQVIYAQR